MAKKAKNRIDGKREPNGRLSRQSEEVKKRLAERFKDMDSEERATIAPGIEARQRVHAKHGIPLPLEQAANPMGGSFIGRLCMNRELSRIQYEAAMLYNEDCDNYAIAVQSPRQPGAVDLNATKGKSNYENVERTKRIMLKMNGDKERGIPGIRQAVQNAQNELRGNANLFGALYELVNRDREVYHLVPDLRVALNALAKFYGLIAKQQKEAA